MLSEENFLNETKNHNPPLQVKWLAVAYRWREEVPFYFWSEQSVRFGYGNRLDRCGARGVYLSERCSQ
jgi:hypothetical protein